jgi:putative membrane protein
MNGYVLATACALFNTGAFVLMSLGFFAIKRQRRERHKRLMLGAFSASCLFLAAYLTRIFLFGDKHFPGQGAARIAYLTLLASHVLLALCTAPLVIATLTQGLRARYASHKRLAKLTLPIWAYVSITGVIVYALLYL